MAILTVSRQIASFGDEICKSIASHLGYKFVSRTDIEKRILDLGFSKSKLKKFDEKKPGFLSSLSSDRDEYLDYLQLAILEAAADDNCVIIGRGSFIILKELPNHISLKIIAEKGLRISRYEDDHKCGLKKALKIVNESDSNRDGFNKSFFDFDVNNPAMFHLVINTGLLDIDSISSSVETLVKNAVTKEKSALGNKKAKELLLAQKIVNLLKYENSLVIKFLRAEANENRITLHGIADSKSEIEKAAKIVNEKLPGYKVVSRISEI